MDLGLATLLGSGLSFVGGLVSNTVNRKTALENLAYQREANNQNIAFQKAENEITRQREDNAITRASIDMQNAGLSKTLAAGNPASAQSLSAPQMNALNNQFKYESALQKMNIASLIQDMAIKNENIKQGWAQIDNNTRETDAKIRHYDSQVHLNESITSLNEIEGEYKAKEIETNIAYQIQKTLESAANVRLTEQDILKRSAEITEVIARTEKLGYESQLLVYDIVSQRLQNLTDAWNFSRYVSYGTPTNYSPSALGKIARDIGAGTFGKMGNDFYIKGLDDIMLGNY